MEVDMLLIMLALIAIGTAVAIVLSIAAFVRSGYPRAQELQLKSLEARVRALWHEVMVLHRAHDQAKATLEKERVTAEQIASQPMIRKSVLPSIHEQEATRATAAETEEGSIVSMSVQPAMGVCPNCHQSWNGDRCDSCGHVLASVQPTAVLQAPLEPQQYRQKERRWHWNRENQAVPNEVMHVQPQTLTELSSGVASARKPLVSHVHPTPLKTETWEAVVGATWLNKIGVLLLVVGIALFIGYSLARLGSTGRLVIAITVSSCMLLIGVALERKALYRIFGRGVAAGGWAGLYFTTYAMHGLDAVRIIDSPTLAFCLLFSVVAGMIAHSLYYRAEMVTAIAFFCGFVAIAISPVSLFSAVACLLLAGALLVVAYHYSWDLLAVSGIICTYGAFAIRFSVALYGSKIWLDITTGHVVIAVCWFLFEAYDIAVVARRRQDIGVGRSLLPLNTCGFLGLSLLQWGPEFSVPYHLFGVTAGAYIVSTIVRFVARPASTFDADTNSIGRAFLGGYEAAITIATALAAIAVWQKYSGAGWRMDVAWLIEAEFLFLAGVLLVQSYLRALALPVFMLTLARFFVYDLPQDGVIHASALELMRWTPLALLMATVFYFNRTLLWCAKERSLQVLEYGYSHIATALVVIVLGFEIWLKHNHLRPEYLGIAWLSLALVLMEVALRTRLVEFYQQSCLVGLLAILTLLVLNGFLVYPDTLPVDTWHLWIWLLPAAVALYTTSVRLNRWPQVGLLPDVLESLNHLTLGAATGMLVLFIWQAFPNPLVAVGWGVCAWMLIQLGFGLKLSALRWQGYGVSGLMVGRLFFANFTNPGMTLDISHRLLTVGPIVLFCYYVANRLSGQRGRASTTQVERSLSRVYLYAAALLTLVLMRFEFGRVLAVLGWSAFGVVLLYIGVRRNNADLRWQSYLIALLTFGRSWGTNFYVPESLSGIFNPVVTGSLVTGCLYLSQVLSPHYNDRVASSQNSGVLGLLQWLDLHARALFCTLGTVLMGVLLAFEVPSRVLTAAWGIEGAVLLFSGFVLRDRVFRLAALAVLGICLPKLFLYDLRELETPYRIFSFVLLGLLLIAASWVYTRFKPQLQAYL